MEKLNTSYYMNSDFELNLKLNSTVDNPKKKLIREELEYLIWWIEDKPINSTKYYSEEYVEYLKSFGLQAKKSDTKEALPYWALDPINPKQRDLNSKIKTAHLFNKLEVNKNSFVLPHEIDEVEQMNFPILVREEFGFSGSDTLVLRENSEFLMWKARLRGKLDKLVFVRYLELKNEFGVIVNRDRSYLIHKNVVDKRGQYRGSTFKVNCSVDLDRNVISKIDQIISNYHDESFDVWGIDFFETNSGDYHFCEINHRKSMGYLARKLSAQYNKNNLEYFGLFMKPQRKCRYFSSFTQLVQDLPESTIMFSPLGNQYFVIGVFGTSEEDVESRWNFIEELLTH